MKKSNPSVPQFSIVSVSVRAGGSVPVNPAGDSSEWSLGSNKSQPADIAFSSCYFPNSLLHNILSHAINRNLLAILP